MEIWKNQFLHHLFNVLFSDFRIKDRTALIGFATIKKT